jgi:hypothetical protein
VECFNQSAALTVGFQEKSAIGSQNGFILPQCVKLLTEIENGPSMF